MAQGFKYLASFFLPHVADWPLLCEPYRIEGSLTHSLFCKTAAGKILVVRKKPLPLPIVRTMLFWEDLLENTSSGKAHKSFIFIMENASLGQIGVYANVNSCNKAVRDSGSLPCEQGLCQLFRELIDSKNLVVMDLADKPISESPALPSLVTTARLSVVEGMIWDMKFGGFKYGDVFTVKPMTFSTVLVPMGTSWQTPFMQKDFLTKTIASLPRKTWPNSVSMETILMIDSSAPPLDVRILTRDALSRIQLLRLRQEDWNLWCDQERSELHSFDDLADHLTWRTKVHAMRNIGSYRVPGSMIAFRAAIWNEAESINGQRPMADWTFLASSSSASRYANCLPDIKTFFHYSNCIEQYAKYSAGSWRHPMERIMVFRTLFYGLCPAEKPLQRMAVTAHEMMMLGFGLLRKDDKYDPKQFNLAVMKKGNWLSHSQLAECLSGFALENAKTLMECEEARALCAICAANKVNTFFDACGHTFCVTCIQTLLQMSEECTCPVCRSPVAGYTMLKRDLRTSETIKLGKQSVIESLTRELQSVLLIVPSEDCIEIVQKWSARDTPVMTMQETPSGQYDNLVFCFAYLSVQDVEQVHRIIQVCAGKNSSIHVLAVDTDDANSKKWSQLLNRAYTFSAEMSTYAQ